MNAVFALIFLGSAALCLVVDPDGFLPALLAGGEKSITVSVSLISVYCVWLGFFKVMEASGFAAKLTQLFYPLARRIFCTDDKEAVFLASSNLTANLLGLPGAPTPLGVKATERFCAAGNTYAADMLFVLNATSLQLLPTTVIAIRASLGSVSPADILIPTLLTTLLSTFSGAFLTALISQKRRQKSKKRAAAEKEKG